MPPRAAEPEAGAVAATPRRAGAVVGDVARSNRRNPGEPVGAAGAVLVPSAYLRTGGEEGPEGWLVRHSGSVVEVMSRGCQERRGGGRRGRVERFSGQARRGMFKTMCATPWGDWKAVPVFSVLTYPWECRPKTAEEAHADLRRFQRRWDRTEWGKQLAGQARAYWNQEFTRRGAVHWNLLHLVRGQTVAPARLKAVRRDLRAEWSRAVASRCGHAHDQVGRGLVVEDLQLRVSAELPEGGPAKVAAYFAGYTTKAGGKEYQHEVPEGWDHSGRWWGRWGIGPAESWRAPAVLEFPAWVRLRRVLTAALVAKARGRRLCGRCVERGRVGCRRCRRYRPRGDPPERIQGRWAVSRVEGGWLGPLGRLLAA